MKIEAEFQGDIFYRIFVSNSTDFRGEETEIVIKNGDLNIPAFYGRYVRVTAECSGAELQQMLITTDKETVTFSYRDLLTNTLPGSASERFVNLDSPISLITEMVITPTAATPYPVDLYVSHFATSPVLIPVVINKAAGGKYIADSYIATDYFENAFGASFALYGIDNQARDGQVDISLRGLPRQLMSGGNLLVIK
jgi:hypothetical protein